MDFNSVAALSAAVAAFFSFVALVLTYFQLRQFRFAHSVDLVFDLEHRFDAPEMINDRKLAARALLAGICEQELEPVLDFFETLGVFVSRHAVDEELVWNSFSYWILRYAALAQGQGRAPQFPAPDPGPLDPVRQAQSRSGQFPRDEAPIEIFGRWVYVLIRSDRTLKVGGRSGVLDSGSLP